jgi:AcrR family transcriptional regulator
VTTAGTVATRGRILEAALDVFARKGYHRATVDDIVRASAMSKGAIYQRLDTTWATKRFEVHDRFRALVQGYLDDAVGEGSIPPLDTRVATLAWLGAVNEIVIQWLHAGTPDLGTTVPTLTGLLLRSIGAGRD